MRSSIPRTPVAVIVVVIVFLQAVVFCMIMHGWTNTLRELFGVKENSTYYIGLILLTAVSIVASVKTEYKKK